MTKPVTTPGEVAAPVRCKCVTVLKTVRDDKLESARDEGQVHRRGTCKGLSGRISGYLRRGNVSAKREHDAITNVSDSQT